MPAGFKDLLRHVPSGLTDLLRHVPTGLNDFWATRSVRVRNSEFLYETSFDDFIISKTWGLQRMLCGLSCCCWVNGMILDVFEWYTLM